jgi:LysR family transcriptional regulator for bpeEF and oprC
VPWLPAFFARYPEISVEVIVTDRNVNLVEEAVDLAIHNGALSDSTSVIRKIAATPVITIASPHYLHTHGEPTTPSELDNHRCVIFSPQGTPKAWGFKGRFGGFEYQPKGSFRTNDADQIRTAVLSHLGLAHTPGWLFAPDIASGDVCRVLCDYEPSPLTISAVRPAGRRLPTKVRVFIDFLAEIFAQESGLSIRTER